MIQCPAKEKKYIAECLKVELGCYITNGIFHLLEVFIQLVFKQSNVVIKGF